MGSQFVSECMQEVSRLLSIRQTTTTPYHPMCNELVENFNGTLKRMLKRLCPEQPKQWHWYIDALLFAYREVPQESSPLGVTVRKSSKRSHAHTTPPLDQRGRRTQCAEVIPVRVRAEGENGRNATTSCQRGAREVANAAEKILRP